MCNFVTDGAKILAGQPGSQPDSRGPVLLNNTGSPVHSSSPAHTSPAHTGPALTGSRSSPVTTRDQALINYPMNRVHNI